MGGGERRRNGGDQLVVMLSLTLFRGSLYQMLSKALAERILTDPNINQLAIQFVGEVSRCSIRGLSSIREHSRM